jgi:hypothetical protein
MAIGTLIGSLGSLILGGYGAYRQEEAGALAQRQYRQETAEEQRRYETKLGLKREEIARDIADRERQWKWREEERDYERMQNLVNNFQGVMREQPWFANNLSQIWRS